MLKYSLLLMVSLWVSACTADNGGYYSTHPQAMQKALDQCPEHSPRNISCEELEKLAGRLKQLATELRTDPQGFGQKILKLQQTIASEAQALSQKAKQPQLKAEHQKNQKELQLRLSVVKWLESPER